MPTMAAVELDKRLRWPENVAALAGECRAYDTEELGQHDWLVDYWAYWGQRIESGQYLSAAEQREIVNIMRRFAVAHRTPDLAENARHNGIVEMTQCFNKQLLGLPVKEPTAGEILRIA